MAIDKILVATVDGLQTELDNSQINPEFSGTEAARMPVGTAAQRGTGKTGDIRHNTDIGKLEQYDGSGWRAIDAPPTLTSISPTSIASSDSADQITLTGDNFSSGATVTAIGQDGSTITASTVTRNSATELVVTFDGTSFDNAQEAYSVKVTNNTGLAITLADSLNVDASPTFVTTTNATVDTIWDRNDPDTNSYTNYGTALSATDPEGGSITFSESGSTLSDIGITVNSDGTLSGDPTNLSGNEETKNFTAAASDGENTTTRTFNLVIRPQTASSWWQSENITDNGSSFTWTDSVSGYDFTSFGTYGDLSYSSSDSNFNNQKTLSMPSNSISGMKTSDSNGRFYTYNSSHSVMVVFRKTGNNGGASYGDCMFGHQVDNAQDGSWSFDISGDHTWGGSYGEMFASTSFSYPKTGIMFVHFNTTLSGSLEYFDAANNSWSTLRSFTNGNHPSNFNFENVSIFNWHRATHSGHSFNGTIAEVAYWTGVNLDSTKRDYWKDYFVEKFNL